MNRSLSPSVYRILLLAYPAHFRRKYGLQMAQVFRDSWRYERGRRGLPPITPSIALAAPCPEALDSSPLH